MYIYSICASLSRARLKVYTLFILMIFDERKEREKRLNFFKLNWSKQKKTAKEQPLVVVWGRTTYNSTKRRRREEELFHARNNKHTTTGTRERERERERESACVCCTNKNKNNAEKQNETTQAQRQSRPQVPAQTETPSDVFSHARGRFIRRVSRTGETWDGEPNRVKRGRAGDGEVLLQSDREALRKRVGVEESHQDEKV